MTNAQILSISTQLQGTRVPEIVAESSEPAEFWTALGGGSSAAYFGNAKFFETCPHPARLYQFFNIFADMDVSCRRAETQRERPETKARCVLRSFAGS